MIIAYRIAQSQFINDISGYGAYLYGGRWNLPGTYALYLASHRSLAYLEYLVHQYARDLWPADLMIAKVEVKDDSLVYELADEELPSNWHSIKYDVNVQKLTGCFFNEKILGLKVPSIVVPGEHNFVLNPKFSDFEKNVTIKEVGPADFDERLKPSK